MALFDPPKPDKFAEIFVAALRDAGDKARSGTAFVSLEPCSHSGRTGPCCEALLAAGISQNTQCIRTEVIR